MTNDRFDTLVSPRGTVDRATQSSGPFASLAGHIRDKALARTLSRRTDRQLADMGLNRETLGEQLKAARHASAPAAAPKEPATGLFGVLEAVALSVLGSLQDRNTARALARQSDRVLADIDLGRDSLLADIRARRIAKAEARGALISQRMTAWREERRIIRELSTYSDRDLAELGMSRDDIFAAARGHAVMLFRDAGLVDSHFAADESQARPANGVQLRRVA